jgi:hypothetical protein
MLERYAIINEAGNWLENIIVLEESDASGWIPPEGTIIKLASEVDFTALSLHPDILNDPVEIIIDIEEAGTY